MQKYERIVAFPGLVNVGIVSFYPDHEALCADSRSLSMTMGANILRAAAPQSYEMLAKMGIKTTLNLQMASEKQKDDTVGIKEIWVPLSVYQSIPPAKFNSIIKVTQDPANYPLLIHCLACHDRTGVVCAARRMAVDGWAWFEAIEEMDHFGYNILTVPLMLSLKDWAKDKGITVT